MSSSDDDALSPQRLRPSFKKDQISSSKKASPIVTAAARRQLRGGTPDQKSAAEIAAEYRRRLHEPEKYSAESKRTEPPAAEGKAPSSTSPQRLPRPNGYTDEAAWLPNSSIPAAAEALTTSALTSPAALRGNHEHPAVNGTPSRGEDDGLHTRMVTIQRRANFGSAGAPPGADIGIGIKFVPNDDGEMTVTSLLPGAPAMESNKIFPGDVIVAVAQVHVHGKTSEEVKSLIMGKPGTSVDLILRKGKPSFNTASPLILSPTPSKPPSPNLAIAQHHTPAKLEPSPLDPAIPEAHKSSAKSVAVDQSDVSIELVDQDAPANQASASPGPSPATRSTGGRATMNPDKTTGGPGRAGIGIKFGIDMNDKVAVINVMPGSPAYESKKVHAKNRIIAVDRVPVHGKTAQEIENLIAGPEGTEVELKIASTMESSEVNAVKLTRKWTGLSIAASHLTPLDSTTSKHTAPPTPIKDSDTLEQRPVPEKPLGVTYAQSASGKNIASVKGSSQASMPEKEAESIVQKEAESIVQKEAESIVQKEAESIVQKEAESIVQGMAYKQIGDGRPQHIPEGVTRQELEALKQGFQQELMSLQRKLLSKLDGIQSEIKRPDEKESSVDQRLGLLESSIQSQRQALVSMKGLEAHVEELIQEKMERKGKNGCCTIS